MPKTWTWDEAQTMQPKRPLPRTWSWDDAQQQRTEPIDLRLITTDNFQQHAADVEKVRVEHLFGRQHQ